MRVGVGGVADFATHSIYQLTSPQRRAVRADDEREGEEWDKRGEGGINASAMEEIGERGEKKEEEEEEMVLFS